MHKNDTTKKLIDKIERLKKEKNAVILAHNYQPGDIQDIADFVGDSLQLSRRGAAAKADVIVFCGVMFMAETAAILSPEKTVLLPEKQAGCPMADMINAEQLQKLKDENPGSLVVCYVNSTAEVKALSDYCCTSSNAVEVVNSIETGREIIFVPDRHLGQFVNERCNREIILWPGYCTTHVRITEGDIEKARIAHPQAIVLAHPECNTEVKQCSDELLSTGQMLKFVQKNCAGEFIIATETGIIHTMEKQNPDKAFYPATARAICPNMKQITLEKVLWSLEDMQYEITVPEKTAEKARIALDRMVAILPS